MEQTVIYETESKYRPYLILEKRGTMETLSFGKFEPYYIFDNGNVTRIEFTRDTEKEELLIKTIKERMAKIGVDPDDKTKHVSFNKDGFPMYYGKTVENFINGSLRNYLESTYYFMPFAELLERIKYYIPDKSFVTKCPLGYSSEFVLTVNKPIFRRDIDNTNKNTFDFIDVEMVIRSTDVNKEKVLKNKKEIFDKAISRIENHRSFKKYGIPVNCLKMYSFILRHDGTLIVSFELKSVKGDK